MIVIIHSERVVEPLEVIENLYQGSLPDGNTNNFAEAHAIEEALQKADELGLNSLEIRTDSQYCIDSLEKWCKGWIRKGKVRKIFLF